MTESPLDNTTPNPSLEEVSSPERLDQLMRVVKPQDWIPAATVGGLTILALVWSTVGRIPMTLTGKGVLIYPQQTIELQSPIAGQLETLSVKDGQCLKKGEQLAAIQPIELAEQLKQQRAKRQQLLVQAANIDSVQQQRTQIEAEAIKASRTSLLQRLQDAKSLSPTLRDQTLLTIQQQRRSLEQKLKDAQAMIPTLKDRWQRRQQLAAEGALEQESLITAEREYRQELQNIEELRVSVRQLEVNGTEVKQRYLQSQSTVSDIQAQLEELETRKKRLDQENLQASNIRSNDIAEVDRAIAQLQKQISERSLIRSPQNGCILEMSVVQGQVINSGTRLGALRTQGEGTATLVGITYFEVKDGKQIKPGMKVQITPDTVKRERFGGIVGTVKTVSSYPVTSTRAASTIGNPELADKLTDKTAKVEVIAELTPEPVNVSSFKWSSSKGPNTQITPGTPVNTRVTVEERAPITFLLPFLREWTGVQ
ncbi:NHLP bacteriocin system secretion protein [Calothrix sp. NIES-2098]|uniref:NHLP bacteriocin system secretion protein n=1 Tax=Calothrix sp. NIES-2098 TaxID=1954171 RepID=UPI000B5F73EF|nr:hypothetical protein NIES2098_34190 [Calothrix sp. NIES-2098]